MYLLVEIEHRQELNYMVIIKFFVMCIAIMHIRIYTYNKTCYEIL